MNKAGVGIGIGLVTVGSIILIASLKETGGGGGGHGSSTIEPPAPGGEQLPVDEVIPVAGDDAGSATGDSVPDDVAGVLGLADQGASFG